MSLRILDIRHWRMVIHRRQETNDCLSFWPRESFQDRAQDGGEKAEPEVSLSRLGETMTPGKPKQLEFSKTEYQRGESSTEIPLKYSVVYSSVFACKGTARDQRKNYTKEQRKQHLEHIEGWEYCQFSPARLENL